MPPPPCLSIVIVSYNTAALLRRCLASVPAGAGDRPYEIIVVDNASTDGSAALVRAEFPAARLIVQRENAGYAAANNVGLVRARGDYLCLLNPDTEVAPGALDRLVGWLEEHPAAGVAAPRLLNPDGSTQATGFRFPGPWQVFFDWFPLHPRLLVSRLNGRYPPRDTPFRIDHPLGACFVVRRAAAAEAGLFDAGYFMYSEEIDWCRRLAAVGWTAWSVPAATVLHHGGASTRQQPAAMFEELHRSRDRYLRRWLPPPAYRLTRLITRLGALAEAWRTFRRRRAHAISAAEADARIRACGRIFRGWRAHAPERIARLPARRDDEPNPCHQRRLFL
jgi:N-acetylglucosaminyl-diphospho-decaprenol L-rhamnosyltransferase